MALFGCIDVALCVDRFQCLGFRQPGIYSLKFRLAYPGAVNKEMCPAIPYNILSDSISNKHSLNTSSLDSEEGWYRTKNFLLRGEPDEKVNIKEVCNFRLVVRSDELDRKGFEVDCVLLCADTEEPTEVDGLKLRTKKQSGVSTYLPVIFQKFGYGSYLDCTLHSQLISFKFSLLKPELEESAKQKKPQKRNPVRYYLGCGQSEPSDFEQPTVYYESFEMYLSQSTNGLNRQLIEQFYQSHLTALRVNFNLLTNRLIDMEAEEYIEQVANSLDEASKKFKWTEEKGLPSAADFLLEANNIGGQIYQLWNLFVKERLYFLDTQEMREDFTQEHEHFFKRFIFKNVKDEEIDQIVKNGFRRNQYVVADLIMPKLNSLFIMERRTQEQLNDGSCDTDLSEICGQLLETTHLLVLVHGYSANRLSLQLIKNAVRYHHPNLELLVSCCNEQATQDHIEDLGRRLAEEIKLFISKKQIKEFKLSFIAHSLGGIVVRASLPYLQSFRGRMHNLITIGSPHLGYLYHNSLIVKTGMWFINRMHQQTSMLMLTMTDKPSLRDTYLYKLSFREGLEWFRNVTFVSSPEDSYVEESSALAANHHNAIQDHKRGAERGLVFREMLQNICSRLTQSNVTRIRCLFDKLEAPLFDRLIGRTAHINYLVDPNFIDLLVLGCRRLFA